MLGLVLSGQQRSPGIPGLLEAVYHHCFCWELPHADTSFRDGGGGLSGLNWRGRCGWRWPVQRRARRGPRSAQRELKHGLRPPQRA
jgi:hypothetical protein